MAEAGDVADLADLDEFEDDIPAGPGLPAWVHRIPRAWVLCAVVAIAVFMRRVAQMDLRDLSAVTALVLARRLAEALVIMAPAVLLAHRPDAFRTDRALAWAAVLLAAGAVLSAFVPLVRNVALDLLAGNEYTGDGLPGLLEVFGSPSGPRDVSAAFQVVAFVLNIPSSMVAVAVPLLLLRGLLSLEGQRPVRRARWIVAGALVMGVAVSVPMMLYGYLVGTIAEVGWVGVLLIAVSRRFDQAWWKAIASSICLGLAASLLTAFSLVLMAGIHDATPAEADWLDAYELAFVVAGEVLSIVETVLLVATFAVVPRTARTELAPASDSYEPYS
jgi:hypothetical protein